MRSMIHAYVTTKLRFHVRVLLVFILVFTLSACVTNPVTGKRDVVLFPESWELQTGAQYYLPLRQQQGGDYVVDPGVESYVRNVGQKLAAQSDRKLPYEFNVINDSTPNAWALPGGKISINRGLLTELGSEAELAAVLAHEIVHAAAKHGALGQSRGVLLQAGVVTATLIGAERGYGQAVQLASTVGAQLINSQYSQKAELESDRFGMEYMAQAGYDPGAAVALQRTFVRLSQGRNNSPLERLFASHPPSQKRVEENVQTARRLPGGGEVGQTAYRQAMSRLFKTADAYKAYDQAKKALNDGNVQQARQLLDTAKRIEPKEALFHSLEGDIALAQKNTTVARRAYSQAISLNPEYFYGYVQRGRIHEAERNDAAAQADFAKSLQFLPTSTAQLGLGQAFERQGNPQVAGRYYAMAAQSNGIEGQRARQALSRLRPAAVSSNTPQTRLMVRQGVDRQGQFVIQLLNQTPYDVAGIQLGLTMRPGGQQQPLTVQERIRSGEMREIATGLQLNEVRASQVRVVVLQAERVR